SGSVDRPRELGLPLRPTLSACDGRLLDDGAAILPPRAGPAGDVFPLRPAPGGAVGRCRQRLCRRDAQPGGQPPPLWGGGAALLASLEAKGEGDTAGE